MVVGAGAGVKGPFAGAGAGVAARSADMGAGAGVAATSTDTGAGAGAKSADAAMLVKAYDISNGTGAG